MLSPSTDACTCANTLWQGLQRVTACIVVGLFNRELEHLSGRVPSPLLPVYITFPHCWCHSTCLQFQTGNAPIHGECFEWEIMHNPWFVVPNYGGCPYYWDFPGISVKLLIRYCGYDLPGQAYVG